MQVTGVDFFAPTEVQLSGQQQISKRDMLFGGHSCRQRQNPEGLELDSKEKLLVGRERAVMANSDQTGQCLNGDSFIIVKCDPKRYLIPRYYRIDLSSGEATPYVSDVASGRCGLKRKSPSEGYSEAGIQVADLQTPVDLTVGSTDGSDLKSCDWRINHGDTHHEQSDTGELCSSSHDVTGVTNEIACTHKLGTRNQKDLLGSDPVPECELDVKKHKEEDGHSWQPPFLESMSEKFEAVSGSSSMLTSEANAYLEMQGALMPHAMDQASYMSALEGLAAVYNSAYTHPLFSFSGCQNPEVLYGDRSNYQASPYRASSGQRAVNHLNKAQKSELITILKNYKPQELGLGDIWSKSNVADLVRRHFQIHCTEDYANNLIYSQKMTFKELNK